MNWSSFRIRHVLLRCDLDQPIDAGRRLIPNFLPLPFCRQNTEAELLGCAMDIKFDVVAVDAEEITSRYCLVESSVVEANLLNSQSRHGIKLKPSLFGFGFQKFDELRTTAKGLDRWCVPVGLNSVPVWGESNQEIASEIVPSSSSMSTGLRSTLQVPAFTAR